MADKNNPQNNRPDNSGNRGNRPVPPANQPYDEYNQYDSPTQNFNPSDGNDYAEDYPTRTLPPNPAKQGYNPGGANTGNNYYPQASDYNSTPNSRANPPSGSYNRQQGQPTYQQGWSAPPEPEDYPPVGGSVPPNRRTGGYRPYRPPVPGAIPPDADDEEYDAPPPSYSVSGSRGGGRFAPPVNPSARPYNWNAPPPPPPAITRSTTGRLIPIVIGLIGVIIVLLVAVIILLLTKSSSNTKTPTTAAQNAVASATAAKPTNTTNALPTVTNGAATNTVVATTVVTATGTPAASPNGSPTPTPGANAATQLAQYYATLTAQIPGTPAITATPANLTGTPSPGISASATVSSSFSPLPSVSIAPADIETLYQAGLQALNQAQWQTAITNLEQVVAAQPQYKDTPTLLAQAYTEQGKASVNSADTIQDVLAARQYFEKALVYKPNDPVIKRLEQELDYYYNGRVQYEQNNWQQAINNFSPLYKLEQNYKDNIQLLYSAYLNQGDLLVNQNKLPDAANDYKLAAALPVTDNSLAQQKLSQIQLLLTPTATPIPTATPTPLATPTPRATPTPPLVNGCPIGNYNFGPWGVVSTNQTSATDQGKGSIAGLVVDLNNQPIGGAAIEIVSSNGQYSFRATTNSGGQYAINGVLGRDNWTVKLLNAPGISICYVQSAYVYVNGVAGSQATVNFVETRP